VRLQRKIVDKFFLSVQVKYASYITVINISDCVLEKLCVFISKLKIEYLFVQ